MPPKAGAVNAAQPSLDTWISVNGGPSNSTAAGTTNSALLPSLHTTSPPLLDRDSIFLASTFPLTAPPTTSSIRTLINLHLSPPRAEGMPKAVERGEGIMPSHRMYAWRCLVPKKGKRPTGGEEDWEVMEGSEDDGEKYGGDRLLGVMRKLGAVDCILFCSRWFGGTLLGTIRFAHIESTAEHALQSHLRVADLLPFLQELQARDARIAQLRLVLPPPASLESGTPIRPPKEPDYSKIDQATAERLLTARGRTIEGLEKRVAELKQLRRNERAEQGRQGLKRAAEAILVEDESDEEVVELRPRKRALPSFQKRTAVTAQGEDDGMGATGVEASEEAREGTERVAPEGPTNAVEGAAAPQELAAMDVDAHSALTDPTAEGVEVEDVSAPLALADSPVAPTVNVADDAPVDEGE